MLIPISIATLLAALFVDEQSRARPLILEAFEVPPSTVFHIRVMDPDAPIVPTLLFIPRIPNKASDREDKTCPRVCFATSLSGAMSSICLGLETMDRIGMTGFAVPKRIDIYTNAHQVRMGVPTEAAVDDAGGTGELWALEPLSLHLLKIINPKQTELLAAAEDYADEHYEEVPGVEPPASEVIRRMAVEKALMEMGLIDAFGDVK